MTTSAAPTEAPSSSSQSSLASRAVTGGVVVVALHVLFWFATTPAYRAEAMVSFSALTLIVTVALLGATVAPRAAGHGLAAIFGVASLLGGLAAMQGALPFLLALVLLVMGASVLAMTFRSYRSGSRAAWAFLAATLGVMAVCTLFGAPKIRNILEVTMWNALLVPGLLTVACVALGMVSEQYNEPLTPRR